MGGGPKQRGSSVGGPGQPPCRAVVRAVDGHADRRATTVELDGGADEGGVEHLAVVTTAVEFRPDGDEVLLGSLNWNNNSARENREVALVLDGSEAGAYFTRVFDADWPPGSTLPVGYLLAIGIVAVGVVLLVRRLRFGEPTGTDDRRAIQD